MAPYELKLCKNEDKGMNELLDMVLTPKYVLKRSKTKEDVENIGSRGTLFFLTVTPYFFV